MANFYGNKVFWAWNGKMEEKQIRKQIRDFAKQGISGFFIHSRCGLQTSYMSDQWIFATRVAIEEARAQGLEVWLYDEDGWPSGFAGGEVVKRNPKLAIQRMKCFYFGADFEDKKIPLDFEVKTNREILPEQQVVAAFRKIGGEIVNSGIDDADYLFVTERDWHYVDLLNPETTKTFIECTHEIYKKNFGQYFGNTVQGIFTDEPQMDSKISYSPVLSMKYQEEYGTKFEEDLKYLFAEDETAFKKFRLRYLRVKFQLFVHSYFEILNNWCKENDLLFVGHLPVEDGLTYQSETAGSCALAYEYMAYPGIDYLGRRMASEVLLKTISSVKCFKGIKRIISESFGCCGWDTTFGEYAWIWGYQAAAGINSACLHFSAYSITGNRKRDYPAFFSEQEPWFGQFKYLNDWMAAANEFISGEEREEKIVVISPLYAAGCAKEDQARHISNEYRVLVEALCDLQLPFDVIDEQALARHATVRDGRIILENCSYGYAIVPYMDSIFKNTAKLLYDFKASGGKLFYTIEAPQKAEYEKDEWLDKLTQLQSTLPNWGIVQNRAALWKKAFEFQPIPRKFYCKPKYSSKEVLSGLRMRVVECGKETHIFLMNKSVSDTKSFYLISEQKGHFTKKFPESLPYVKVKSDRAIEVKLPPMQSVGYTFGNSEMGDEIANISSFVPEMIAAQMNAENKLTIDRCSYSIDGGAYTSVKDVLFAQDEIFRLSRTLKRSKDLKVRYSIFADAELPVRVFIEKRGVRKITWNGEVCRKTGQSFMDKGICSILPCRLHKGENELVLEYKLEPSRMEYNPQEVFESDRNRFSYEREIEAVYVCGNFMVCPQGKPEWRLEYWNASGDFVINEPKEVDFTGDITPQGYYFYSGSMQKTFEFQYKEGRIKLKMQDMKAVCAEVFLNGKSAGCLFSEYSEIDLTKFLKGGTNYLRVVYYSSLRNLLGPHHHYRGVVCFTGQNTFIGKRGWEDMIMDYTGKENTYTDSYSFVSFSGGIPILECFEVVSKL